MSRVAAIDLGTNSVRLLVADHGTPPREVLRRSEVVRLGEGVDATGRLSGGGLARTRARLADYADDCRRLGVSHIAMAATSATRDAANGAEVARIVAETLGDWAVRPQVLSGGDEACLTFAGAVAAVSSAGVEGPYAVVDLGGGSTEIVRGVAHPDAAWSVQLGAVRQAERVAPSDPMTAADRAVIEEAVDAVLPAGAFTGVRTLVGVAGTATSVVAHRLRLPAYDTATVHLDITSPDECVAACRHLASLSTAERAGLPYVTPGRADILGVGATIWARIVEHAAGAGVPRVVTSEHDILDALLPQV